MAAFDAYQIRCDLHSTLLSFVVVLVLFGIIYQSIGQDLKKIYGPKCLNCKGVRDPAQCMSATTCWASQQCYTERYVHADGQVLYDFGCKIQGECELISRSRDKRLDITIDLCEECCVGEFCNVNVCVNQTASPSLACFSCEDVGNPDDCHVLSRCGQNEICYGEKVITDSPLPRHSLGCLSKQVCGFLNKGGQPLFGKRAMLSGKSKRSTHLCQKCCSHSGCNLEICGDNQEVQQTTPQSTTNRFPWSTYHSTNWGTASTWHRELTSKPTTYPWSTFKTTRGSSMSKGTTYMGTWATKLPPASSTYIYTSPIGGVRLAGGNNSYEGRVEILHNGAWGTVCDHGFNNKAASVVCHMLGYSRYGAVAQRLAFFGEGQGRIWLDDLHCSGHEDSLNDCSHANYGSNNCQHSRDAGVQCIDIQDFGIKLVGGNVHNEGRIEISLNNTWGTVCDDNFGTAEASVFCHMLGYPRDGAKAYTKGHFGQGNGTIWLDDLTCTGNESSIFYCDHKHLGQSNCQHSEDAGISCYVPSCPDGYVKYHSHCYMFNYPPVKSYAEAEAKCKSSESSLVSILSGGEQEFIVDYLKKIAGGTHEWMTSAKFENSHWTWSSNGTKITIEFGNLSSPSGSQPSTGPCLSLLESRNYALVDVNCDGFDRNFICEMEIS